MAKKDDEIIDRGTRGEKALQARVPLVDKPSSIANRFSRETIPLLEAMSNSIDGKLIEVDYHLKVCMKHNAWNSSEEGKVKKLSIKMWSPSPEIAQPIHVVAPQIAAPVGWAPIIYGAPQP